MDSFDEFEQDLNRITLNAKSSRIERNRSQHNGGNVQFPCRKQATNQNLVNYSQYSVENVPARERNFQIYEDTQPVVRRSNLRARYIDPNFHDSELASSFARSRAQTPIRLQCCQRNFQYPCSSVLRHVNFQREFPVHQNEDLMDDSRNFSGRPLNLSYTGDVCGQNNQQPRNPHQNSQQSSIIPDYVEQSSNSTLKNSSNIITYQEPEDHNKEHKRRRMDSFEYAIMKRGRDKPSSESSNRTLTPERFSQSAQVIQVPRTIYPNYKNNLTEGESMQALEKPCETKTCKIRTNAKEERRPCSLRTQQCPELSQRDLQQFLQSGDLINSKFDELSTRHPLFNVLVKDGYYPGAIEDSLNGVIQFNRIAFDAVFDINNIPQKIEPKDVPLTLLEAFELRIQYEKEMQENPVKSKKTCPKKKASPKKISVEEGHEDKPSESNPYDENFWTHRDELKLASTLAIDLRASQREHPETGLTKAIVALFKAEKMERYDKEVHKAEQAIRAATPNGQEKAALNSTCSFHLDMESDEMKPEKTYKPLEIITYIGTTKPNEGAD